MTTSSIMFWGSAGLVAAVFACNPLALYLAARRRRGGVPPETPAPSPRCVSLVIVGRLDPALREAKIDNCLALRFPSPQHEIVIMSDGPDPDGVAALQARAVANLRPGATPARCGKNRTLNAAVETCRGDVLVFTDLDAMLEPGALEALLAPLADPAVGGACGQRVIGETDGALHDGQAGYIASDSALKRWESRGGSLTSNDGKLYAMRRELFRPVPDGVTDDLYNALSVVDSGHRFVFAPGARAHIPAPSRSAAHELQRRRRIVCRSLRGLARRPRLLDPRRHGLYAVRLAVNKVGRRLTPWALAVMTAGALGTAPSSLAARAFLALEVLSWLTAAAAPLARRLPRHAGRLAAAAAYFWIGTLGTLLGTIDAAAGRTYVTWEPRKGATAR